jgi:2-polyprenyl-6-methoxyphenol hydroxylase-like FAD-dependent oxidoreductase
VFVLVIGAGIGGLAAAVALRRIAVETLVIERATSIREVGTGLSIWSNAMNALRELGLEACVTASASVIERNFIQTPAGGLIVVHWANPEGANIFTILSRALKKLPLPTAHCRRQKDSSTRWIPFTAAFQLTVCSTNPCAVNCVSCLPRKLADGSRRMCRLVAQLRPTWPSPPL